MALIGSEQCGRSRAERRVWWRAHVVAQAGSGWSGVEYCREHGLHLKSFYRWRRRLGVSKELDGLSEESPSVRSHGRNGLAFAEVMVASAAGSTAALEVVLAGGRRIEVHPGFDEDTLARVVAVLERVSC